LIPVSFRGDGGVEDRRFVGPRIVGVVNITEDSFSDGGLSLRPEAATEHALELHRDGAEVIELGPASSHPDAARDHCCRRATSTGPVLERLADARVPTSVDSFLVETQRFALTHGVTMLNDIHGFPHPEFYDELATASLGPITFRDRPVRPLRHSSPRSEA
jgi:dihydropteroate synthase type 2